MEVYPKVPRWDHGSLEESDLWSADDLSLLEKVDGQNYRFFLYDPTIDWYVENFLEDNTPSEIPKEDISEKEIVFGTKNVVRGTTGMSRNDVDSRYYRAYDILCEVDKSMLEELQEKYGPMIFFAEHMIPHSIKEYYQGDGIPSLIGFDIYCPRRDNRETYASNPYEEKFTGYLDIVKCEEIFQELGVEFAPILEGDPDISCFEDVKDFEIPTSKYANCPAEGIVLRSDKVERRSKKRSEYFHEINKKSWGINPKDAETGEELLVSKTATTPRFRKIFEKIKNKDKSYEDLALLTLEDIWEEEIEEIMSMNLRYIENDKEIKFNPYKMKDLVEKRAEGEIEKIIETANLIEEYEGESEIPKSAGDINLEIELERIEIDSENVEQTIVDKYVDKNLVLEIAEYEGDGEIKKEHINKIYKKVAEEMWYRNWKEIMRIDAEFEPSKITDLTAKKTAEIITEYVENKNSKD